MTRPQCDARNVLTLYYYARAAGPPRGHAIILRAVFLRKAVGSYFMYMPDANVLLCGFNAKSQV